jgi:hypothetical protein
MSTPQNVRNSAVDRQKNDTLSLHICSLMVTLHGLVLASGHCLPGKKPIPSRKNGLFGKKLGGLTICSNADPLFSVPNLTEAFFCSISYKGNPASSMP